MGLSRKLRRGDNLTIGDVLIRCLSGSLRVEIVAPKHRHSEIRHIPKRRNTLTLRQKVRKIRSDE